MFKGMYLPQANLSATILEPHKIHKNFMTQKSKMAASNSSVFLKILEHIYKVMFVYVFILGRHI